jgi:hypothetical protein
MSLYQLQKVLYVMNREPSAQAQYETDLAGLLKSYELSEEERTALADGDIGLLYVLGVNGQILMHFAAFRGVAWFDYLDLMRKGIEKHGPVRAGVYAMTGAGQSFAAEEGPR